MVDSSSSSLRLASAALRLRFFVPAAEAEAEAEAEIFGLVALNDLGAVVFSWVALPLVALRLRLMPWNFWLGEWGVSRWRGKMVVVFRIRHDSERQRFWKPSM